jgi:hypothetical protein
MLDIDEAVYRAADEWFILAADDVDQHGDSDDAAFDRWLASLPAGGLDDILNEFAEGDLSTAFARHAQQSARPWRA